MWHKCKASVTPLEIDDVEWRLARLGPINVIDYRLDRSFGRREGGNVWCDDDARMIPERMIVREGFLLEDVEGGAADLAVIERLQQIGFD